MIKKIKFRRRPPRRTIIKKDALPLNLWLILKVARYYHRPSPMNDWIKEEKEGRFHIKKIAAGEYQLHYDTYGENCDHYSIPMPFKCAQERRRLWSIAKNLSAQTIPKP